MPDQSGSPGQGERSDAVLRTAMPVTTTERGDAVCVKPGHEEVNNPMTKRRDNPKTKKTAGFPPPFSLIFEFRSTQELEDALFRPS